MKKTIKAMTLDQCKTGQHCQLIRLKGDVDLKMRLINLGFHTHSIIQLLMTRGQNFVINVDGSRFALDKTYAKFIEVEPLS